MGNHKRRPKSPQVADRPRNTIVVPEERPSQVSLTRFEAEIFEGPLPHPETLAHYESICPGAADRILGMAESQARHRQDLEKLVITSNCRAQDRGPILGFILALGVICFGGYLILQGKEISGLVALVTALVAIVVPFIYGKTAQKKELQEKREDLAPAPREDWEYSAPPETAKRARKEAGS